MESLRPNGVFLLASARTGGTLLATMLDAHPDLAMSYELYEEYLRTAEGEGIAPRQFVAQLEAARPQDGSDDPWCRGIAATPLRRFVACGRRGGLSVAQIFERLGDHVAAGGAFRSFADRMTFIESLMRAKMEMVAKRRWGGKFKGNWRDLERYAPHALLLAVLRDGRDVLASRLQHKGFQATVDGFAREWVDRIRAVHEWRRRNPRVLPVRYEALVLHPAETLRQVCDHIDLPYRPQMIEYLQTSPALLKNPHGHLSVANIARGLNPDSLGRWKRDLSDEQVDRFQAIAGAVLEEMGYPLATGRADG